MNLIYQKLRKPKDKAIDSLSQDFQSFDILWFDLVTKTRQLVNELCVPLVDKVHEHKDLIHQLIRQAEDNFKKIENLEAIVYHKG